MSQKKNYRKTNQAYFNQHATRGINSTLFKYFYFII